MHSAAGDATKHTANKISRGAIAVDEDRFRQIIREELAELLARVSRPAALAVVPGDGAAGDSSQALGGSLLPSEPAVSDPSRSQGLTRQRTQYDRAKVLKKTLSMAHEQRGDSSQSGAQSPVEVLRQIPGCMACVQQDEPERVSRFDRFIDTYVEVLGRVVIAFNMVFMFFRLNYEVANSGSSTTWIRVVDILLVTFYLAEVVLKIASHRQYFFTNDEQLWNLMDVVLVILGIVQLFFDGVQVTFLRSLRSLKIVKALRMFRLIRAVDVLRRMLNAVMGSLVSLGWSIVMMSLIYYIFACIMVQGVATYLEEGGGDPLGDAQLMAYYPSVQKTMFGLFVAQTGGEDWKNYYETLLVAGNEYGAVYLFFVAFSQIALMNILTGIFVEQALELAKPDSRATGERERRKVERKRNELERIVRAANTSGTGFISEREFLRALNASDRKLSLHLMSLGIQHHDAVYFFRILKSACYEEDVAVDDFVDGLLKLEGDLHIADMQGLIIEVKVVHEKIHELYEALGIPHRQVGAAHAQHAFLSRVPSQ